MITIFGARVFKVYDNRHNSRKPSVDIPTLGRNMQMPLQVDRCALSPR
jgi:hypothetical protein